jgi:hypothetical protein
LFLVAELTKRAMVKQPKDGKLFPVKPLSKVLGKYCEKLKAKEPIKHEQQDYGANLGLFLPKTFGSPKSVVEYLGRYTHKITIAIIESEY